MSGGARSWHLLAPLCALLLFVLQTGPAFAHAALVESDPPDGAVLAAPPARLVLTFNEPVSPIALRLIDDQGRATLLANRRDGNSLVIDQPGAMESGTHVLSWRVISEDGHPVGGSVVFSLGAPSSSTVAGTPDVTDWPLAIAIWGCRLVLYLGLFVGIGGVFFGVFVAREARPGSRVDRGLMLLAAASIPLALRLQGLDALGLPLTTVFAGSSAWHAALTTSYAMALAIALVALGAGLMATGTRHASSALLTAAAFLGVGLALSASGHASTAPPRLLTRPAVFLHAEAVTFWIGAFLPLAIALRRGQGTLPLMRFSRAIPFAIVPLLVTGVGLAVVQVGAPAYLIGTAYGRLLLIKLGLVIALFLLAAVNRWRLTAPVAAGEPAAIRRLITAIAIEGVLAVGILAVVATWRFTPPPRAIEVAAALPVTLQLQAATAQAEVTVSPGRVGPVSVAIAVATPARAPLEAKEVTLTLSNPTAGIEAIKRPATKLAAGTWTISGLVIPLAGHWNMEIDVLVSDFEVVRLTGSIDIPR